MSRLHTSVREDAHAYTRTKCPWILSEQASSGGRLMHYISGGGMKAFGRTVHQEVIRRRHIGFWMVTAVLVVLWICFWVF